MNITEIAFYGVLILIAINLILFFALLINKIVNNRKAEENKRLAVFYEAMIYQYISEKEKEIPKPKNAEERGILKNIILDSFLKYEPSTHGHLRKIARETGFVEEEMKALKNPSDLRKAVAAYALGILRIREALPLLKKIRTDQRELSQCVTRALIQIGGTEEIDHVITNMKSTDYAQKAKVLELLSEITEEDIFPQMETYMKGEDPVKKSLAIETLGTRKDVRVKPYIREGLFSEEKEVKISALKAAISLKCFDCGEMKNLLSVLLQDKDWEIRAFTARAMSHAEDPDEEVLSGLKKLMEDPNWFVRFNASESLFQLGEKGVLALSENLFSTDSFARDKAWGIISRELALYDLRGRISGFRNGDQILENINTYKKKKMEVRTNA
ncbi:HEAT repeat domain-containing protein [Proteiniclasticum sp. SCR006]|uniref:HEAT repeat domain-containing protein n=1 Tax=Proteiniclasticum aestuarii TaxID=2817862 RepID=A0A939HEJ6_9CLOT|nr:HEAT repeat domain-containing protein [Proteiniclasticum aestuarii]MBO1265853.1 HEAT repeat domain-containing protein [Proteiniclasticum aestuarii]